MSFLGMKSRSIKQSPCVLPLDDHEDRGTEDMGEGVCRGLLRRGSGEQLGGQWEGPWGLGSWLRGWGSSWAAALVKTRASTGPHIAWWDLSVLLPGAH